jgi:hypothetical protein
MNETSQGSDPVEKKPTPPDVDGNSEKKNEPNPTASPLPAAKADPCPPATTEPKKNKKEWLGCIKIHVKAWKDTYECIAFFAAIFIAGTAVWQIWETSETRTLDERAWVGAIEITPVISEEGSRYYQVKFKNTGKTPAINVAPIVGAYLSEKEIPTKDECPKTPSHVGLLQPGADGFVTTKTHPLSPLAVSEIQRGSNYFVAGTIWYDDIFSRTHWSQFCYHIKPDLIPEYPAFHNSCSEAEASQHK